MDVLRLSWRIVFYECLARDVVLLLERVKRIKLDFGGCK